MISTKEEATKHAAHVKGKHIIVLPDGNIYSESSDESAQSLVDKHDCFVVKGGLSKSESSHNTHEDN